jgi:hypothetical protein
MLNPQSLAQTLDAVNEAVFFATKISPAQRKETVDWLVSRINPPDSRGYAGMPALTLADHKNPIRLFTGETLTSGASKAHIMGEEACRALILLKPTGKKYDEAIHLASQKMIQNIAESQNRTRGMFCCGKCSVSLWRHLAVGGLADNEYLLTQGLKSLRNARDEKGRWGIFPFYYTLLALTEMNLPAARKELQYAAPLLEKTAKRAAGANPYAQRRYALAERALALC